ncbi:MAG: ABC transporter permease [Nocardioidaceae bacterium]|nr:ABC transporter permease [Nocardioidaceae bacterium]MCL2612034.1 ABC transporter permease [Nocardioidaceae bacterium]
MKHALGRPPVALLLVATLAVAVVALPLVALVAQAHPKAISEALRSQALRQAMWLSLITSVASTTICAVLGLPLAWVLARLTFPGRKLLRALVAVPMLMPPVVGGVALEAAFGRTGLFGAPLLAHTGFSFPYTTWGVVLAHVFVCLPFVVISLEGSLRALGQEYDVAAATLGASRWHAFRRVTLPLALPGIGASLLLGWARSLGEFGATITFNGNYPGTTQTMPTLIYVAHESDEQAVVALSLIMLAVSIGILVALRDRWLVAA